MFNYLMLQIDQGGYQTHNSYSVYLTQILFLT